MTAHHSHHHLLRAHPQPLQLPIGDFHPYSYFQPITLLAQIAAMGKTAVHFGGGNIGRGFVAEKLVMSGYEVRSLHNNNHSMLSDSHIGCIC